MNLTEATSVIINNKTVERIMINGKTVYNTIQMLLSTNKEHIKTDESAIVNIESNIKNKTIELWKVINMTRTSMGTQTTGSDGKASWTYTGTGAGDVQFIATYDDIESNTVTIEDYTPVIMRAVLTADKTTIISGESVTLSCNYFDQYNELTADYYSSTLYDGSTIVEMGGWECPDVFTVSGLSVGTHSFKVVVTNQDHSEVDSNIVNVVVEDSFDGMSLGLSAGSQILSYADEQSVPDSQFATVTAQLLDGQSSATVSNVPVVFGAYQNDVLITGSEQTVNTDGNGQASYTYHSAGRGDVVVKAVPDNRTLLTKTYEVHDYWKHIDTVTVTGDGTPNYHIFSQVTQYQGDAVFSADYIKTDTNLVDGGGLILGDRVLSNQVLSSTAFNGVKLGQYNNTRGVYEYNTSSPTDYRSSATNDRNIKHNLTIIKQNNQLRGIVTRLTDDTVIYDRTITPKSDYTYFQLCVWSSAVFVFSDIIIKPL